MRVFVGVLLAVLSVSLAAAAADLKVKVVDPQGAAVSGAQVLLDCLEDVAFLHVVRNTAGDGTVTFTAACSKHERLQVLAPGFALETADVSSQAEVTV
ncbi:MAG TPA: hypothetical protein VK706_17260, partial [Candidatus Sulfotelmatobacter sp.]|nr:hypothetical protein [Candidatus Sulfotelmatobacter sp.]